MPANFQIIRSVIIRYLMTARIPLESLDRDARIFLAHLKPPCFEMKLHVVVKWLTNIDDAAFHEN